MNFQGLSMIAIVLVMTGCSGIHSARVDVMQPEDKQLSCTDLEIAMHEADFLRNRAIYNKSFSFGDVFTPWRYVSTRSSADDAIEASDERVEYLQRMHEIRGCGNQPTQEVFQQPPQMHPQAVQQQGQYAPQQGGYYPAQAQQPVAQPQHYGLDYQPQPGYAPQHGAAYQPAGYSGASYQR